MNEETLDDETQSSLMSSRNRLETLQSFSKGSYSCPAEQTMTLWQDFPSGEVHMNPYTPPMSDGQDRFHCNLPGASVVVPLTPPLSVEDLDFPEKQLYKPQEFNNVQSLFNASTTETSVCNRFASALLLGSSKSSQRNTSRRSDLIGNGSSHADPQEAGKAMHTNASSSSAELLQFPKTRSRGPRILSDDEIDAEYAAFVQEVDGDNLHYLERDFEGDPRQHRISPETFLTWAEGSSRNNGHYDGDAQRLHSKSWGLGRGESSHLAKATSLQETKEPLEWFQTTNQVPSKERTPLEPQCLPARDKKSNLLRIRTAVPAYDQQSGDPISPIYSLDEAPTTLRSPAVTDDMYLPSNISRTVPTFNANYSGRSNNDTSTSGVFTAVGGRHVVNLRAITNVFRAILRSF